MDKYHNASAKNRTLIDPGNNESKFCNDVPEDFMHLIRDAAPGASDLPWCGVIFGLAISHIWYFCTDQVTHFIVLTLWTYFDQYIPVEST